MIDAGRVLGQPRYFRRMKSPIASVSSPVE
jgi:hypothetical protein